MFHGRINVETDKAKTIQWGLLNPHYTDDRFRSDQTVFLAEGYSTVMNYGTPMVQDANYDYSDRIAGWYDSEARDTAWKAAEEQGHAKDSAALIEAYLRGLYKDPELKLVHIVAGVNRSNGYPYRVYGYILSKKGEQE